MTRLLSGWIQSHTRTTGARKAEGHWGLCRWMTVHSQACVWHTPGFMKIVKF